ncbi:phenylacetate--CoA ligase [Christensenellaceae bacterium NSJ-44]|uniref:Phenylacetate-coenzyme A ligase n=1 Tax=Luoshenia tenuis TaxID=2763654 RepID=A0A926HNZ6_9FIRM|nr:phenylacetate--CoA ligase [Luoshenia tenuis]MBC8530150.1 phenylacetate--CoA ligase [Luoshenia tenuis]
MIWDPQFECMPHSDMRALQLERLQKMVQYAYDRVPFYRKKFDAIHLKPSDIHSLEDVAKIPFTVKNDLRDHYPYGLFAVPMKEIVRIHASSGTTGRSTVVGYTKKDLDTWSTAIARIAAQGGATDNDIAQIAFGYGLFTGGFGLHYGLEKLGAAVIPMSTGNTEKQIKIMRDFGSTVLVSTPSYALYMAEVAEKAGSNPAELPLKYGLFGGEGSTESMRAEIERRWDMQATENYGMSEVMGPGVAGECLEKHGMHINEDLFYVEIIDPETGEVLPEGAKGEVVITTLCKEGIPMLRYRSKDISYLMGEPCPCGRLTTRLAKIEGRTDDMLIIRGVNVFPSQIEEVLISIPEVGPHYEIIVSRRNYLDVLEINVEVADGKLLESFSGLEKLEEEIKRKLRVMLGLDAKINLVEPETLKRFMGKAQRVTDLRN